VPYRREADKLVNACQTWEVFPRNDAPLDVRIARELADCRVRGLDRLDISTRNQQPVPAAELERLAIAYVAAQPVPTRGRIPQIKLLLRAAAAELMKSNEPDADLISDLFFGDDSATSRRYPTELLKRARERYGEPSQDRFREIRNVVFRSFAQFLIEFVGAASQQAPRPEAPSQQTEAAPVANEPIGTASAVTVLASSVAASGPARRYVHTNLVAVLRFSGVDPGHSKVPTIDEHREIIGKRGGCWWGWFRSAQDDNYYQQIDRRLKGNCEVGLWERSQGLFYVAECDGSVGDDGNVITSPEKLLTPEYYRNEPYPAWFRFKSIRDSSKQEFEERFGHLSNSRATIYWNPEPDPEPVVIQAAGSAIVHLSDLRFGQHHRWSTASEPHRSFISTEGAIGQTLRLNDIDLAAVGAVVISGNFASDQPNVRAFTDALAFVDGLCEEFPNLTHDHFIIVPGSDDFARPGDREQSGQQLYRDFHESLYGGGDRDLGRMRRYEFDHFRLNVLPVNSVKMLGVEERDEGLFGFGYDSLLNVMRDDYLRNHHTRVVINVVTAHHHAMSTAVRLPSTAGANSAHARVMPGMRDALDMHAKLRASRVAIYLHGHLHNADNYAHVSDDGWRTVVSGAGTAGAADSWLRAHFRDNYGNSLTVIDVADNLVRGRTFVYDEEFQPSPSPYREFAIEVQ
jgi:hypothetical protein